VSRGRLITRLVGRLAALLSGGSRDEGIYRTAVRCGRCGEEIPVRVDLSRELTPTYGEQEGAYHVRKGVVGSGENRCFRTLVVRLTFDREKEVVGREVKGGSFVDGEPLDEPS